jgi:hypothetical protein
MPDLTLSDAPPKATSSAVYWTCGALALLALVGTWGHNIAYLPLGFLGATAQFWRETLATPASRSITFDLFALILPVFYWMFSEARRLSMRGIWWYVLASFLIAISVAVPVFLMHRARVISQGKPASGTAGLSRGEQLGFVALVVPVLAYFVWSFSV